MTGTISLARAKVQRYVDSNELCDNLEDCPGIGWASPNGNNAPDDFVGLLKIAYRILKATNSDYLVLNFYIWSSTIHELSETKLISFAPATGLHPASQSKPSVHSTTKYLSTSDLVVDGFPSVTFSMCLFLPHR